MTFQVLLVKDHQRRVVGVLWAENESNALALAPALYGKAEGAQISICRTEDREIPLRLNNAEPMRFC